MADLNTSDCINKDCSFTGHSISDSALCEYQGHTVGFCRAEHRDQFNKIYKKIRTHLAAGGGQDHTINRTCPILGSKIERTVIVEPEGCKVGFCSDKHARDFLRAKRLLDQAVSNCTA